MAEKLGGALWSAALAPMLRSRRASGRWRSVLPELGRVTPRASCRGQSWRGQGRRGHPARGLGPVGCGASAAAVLLAAAASSLKVTCRCQGEDAEAGQASEAAPKDAEESSRAALARFVRRGDVAAALRLLPLVLGSIDEPLTSFGETALAIACAAGALPLVAALLDAGASPTAADSRGASCLLIACEKGHAHVVRQLLASGRVDTVLADIYGLAPVHKAAAFGHTQVLRRLLEHGADPDLLTSEVTAPAEYGAMPSRHEAALHIVARLLTRDVSDARLECRTLMELLVEHGANVLNRDFRGDTPLHLCARSGDLRGLRLLLADGVADLGAAAHAANAAGASVLDEVDDACGRVAGTALRLAVLLQPWWGRWRRLWSLYDL